MAPIEWSALWGVLTPVFRRRTHRTLTDLGEKGWSSLRHGLHLHKIWNLREARCGSVMA